MKVIVVGGGEMGRHLALLLLAGGHEVKVVEISAQGLLDQPGALPRSSVVAGNGAHPQVLEAAGVRQAHVVAAVTGSDEINLVTASLAKLVFGVKLVIARVKKPDSAWLFTPVMGVDVALNQADLLAHLIAHEMDLGDMLTLLKLRQGQYSLVEKKVHPEARAAGRAVKDVPLPAECVLAAVIRKGRLIIPRGPTVLEPGDEVLAVVHAGQAEELAALLGQAPNP